MIILRVKSDAQLKRASFFMTKNEEWKVKYDRINVRKFI